MDEYMVLWNAGAGPFDSVAAAQAAMAEQVNAGRITHGEVVIARVVKRVPVVPTPPIQQPDPPPSIAMPTAVAA